MLYLSRDIIVKKNRTYLIYVVFFFQDVDCQCRVKSMSDTEKSPSVLLEELDRLRLLACNMKEARSIQERLEILNADHIVKEFFKNQSLDQAFPSEVSIEGEAAIKSVIAIGQAGRVFAVSAGALEVSDRLRDVLEILLRVDRFYSSIGGIVGYHWSVISLFASSLEINCDKRSFIPPVGIDIAMKNREVLDNIAVGIERIKELAEIYAVGGAADRLRLQDPETGMPLPAARLTFAGKTLLETLVVDVQAREYLYFKLFGEQLTTPIALMTSEEKENHQQILSLCNEQKWFGRPRGSFFLFCQPSVPAVDREGNWCMTGMMRLLLKPGGHGVIWKLAKDCGVFDWLLEQGRKKALVRQINNPIAGIDDGLLAFTGIGLSQDKVFGFASCPRQVKSAEGINVVVEKQDNSGFSYCLTNIEYCDFKKHQITDEPAAPGSTYSKFPSNTNILFVDLAAISKNIDKMPIPGRLINFKKTEFQTEDGGIKELEICRLESTMQNIADELIDTFSQSLAAEDFFRFKTFLTYNKRHKTISTVKKEYVIGGPLLETPEGCYLDFFRNAHDLLSNYCRFSVPDFDECVPSFFFTYHPALGPLYSIIAQKVRVGKIHPGSALELNIAEVDIEGLDLQGSLRIAAENVMGEVDGLGVLQYGRGSGKCQLKNVVVQNLGISLDSQRDFWRGSFKHEEICEIFLEKDAEFLAENVTLAGGLSIVVPRGTRVRAVQGKDGVSF